MSKCPTCGCTCGGYCEEDGLVDDEDREDWYDECDECGREDCICSLMDGCSCGAWAWSKSKQQMVKISDCIC